MILYTNGDSHTAAAECVNNHAFAEDDKRYFMMGRAPHPDNLERSWSKLLSQRLSCGLKCHAESASSNDRIMRTTRQWLEKQAKDINRTLYVIQWSTWEREEWLIDDEYYQINASGIDDVPPHFHDAYKNYVANVDGDTKTKQAHEDIWQFHLELEQLGAKHIFFNGNSDFNKIKLWDKQNGEKEWGSSYIEPYDPDHTFNAVVGARCDTVSPASWHYGVDGHRVWAQYITKYIIDNQLV
jgi:hypothetical protein